MKWRNEIENKLLLRKPVWRFANRDLKKCVTIGNKTIEIIISNKNGKKENFKGSCCTCYAISTSQKKKHIKLNNFLEKHDFGEENISEVFVCNVNKSSPIWKEQIDNRIKIHFIDIHSTLATNFYRELWQKTCSSWPVHKLNKCF